MKTKKTVVTLLALAGLLSFSMAAAAGNLEPNAPPGSTMKTLDQVEPRTPITSLPYTISASGSYYLAKNLNATGTAITVTADNVTIDLCGFTLTGPSSGVNYGIYMNGRSNVEIRNGTICNFYGGIQEESALNGIGHRVIGIRAIANSRYGIQLYGNGHEVKNCIARNNGGGATVDPVYGIYVDTGCTVTGNTVYNNGYSATVSVYGIFAGQGSTVSANNASRNGASSSSWVWGILVGSGSSVIGNTVTLTGNGASGTVCGIGLDGNSLVDQNVACNNTGTNMNHPANCDYGTNHAP
jgi:hypothetical protein